MLPQYSKELTENLKTLNQANSLWVSVVRACLCEEEDMRDVKVFESRTEDEDPCDLKFRDMITADGQFDMHKWAHNVKIGVWIRKRFE